MQNLVYGHFNKESSKQRTSAATIENSGWKRRCLWQQATHNAQNLAKRLISQSFSIRLAALPQLAPRENSET
jgi:hypothetical protein